MIDKQLAAAFRDIVGDGYFLDNPDELANYADPFAFDSDFAAAPVAAVLPGSVAEVQAIVRAAVAHNASLWTVSRGRNLGYGGASPRDPESIVVDLQRLDRICEVDAERGYVVVEPGVSFFALFEHLRSTDTPLLMSVPDLGGGSIIGNALERGFGYAAHGQHAEYICGLEVVMPDGEIVRTGMGAFDDTDAWHLYKGGFGPSIDGLLFQSGMGIVVSAGVWLMPRPAQIAAVLLSTENPAGLAGLVDTVRPLMLDRTIDGVAIIGNALAIASGIMTRGAISASAEPLPTEAILAVARKLHVGYWNAKFGLYGHPAIIDAKLQVITEAIAPHPEITLTVRRYEGDVDPATVHPGDRAQLGIPSSDLIQMAAWRGGTPAHTDFSVVASTVGSEAQKLVDLTRDMIEAEGLDHVGGFTMFGRHAIMLNLVAFDAANDAERAMVRSLFARLIDTAAGEGFTPYRAHPAFMDHIASLANDGSLRETVRTIKNAIDPTGVLNPGKQGIWPALVRA